MDALNKVWVIVYRIDRAETKLLLLKPNPEPNMAYDYYVITGGVEDTETIEQAAKRETFEEIGIEPLRIVNLNTTMSYLNKNSGEEVVENCFAAQVDYSDIILNEEHIDYKWFSIREFEETIWWTDSREKLKEIMDKFRKILEK